MAPAMGRTEMRYFGISLFSRLAKVTSALWPAVPTGGVPQRMSCCAHAAEFVNPTSIAAAKVVRARWRMAFPRFYGEKPTEGSRTIRQLRGIGKWKNAAPARAAPSHRCALGLFDSPGPAF